MMFRTRAIALGLSVLMVLTSVPQTVFATEINADNAVELTSEAVNNVDSTIIDSKAVAEENLDTVLGEDLAVEEEIAVMSEEDIIEEELEDNNAKNEYLFKVNEEGVLAYIDDTNVKVTGKIDIKARTNGEVKVIPDSFFADNELITGVIIPSSVEKFGTKCFKDCTKLQAVEFENDTVAAKELSADMFAGCSALAKATDEKSFSIPNGIETIGARCFFQCKGLSNVNFKTASSLTTIKESAFASCDSLDTLIGLTSSNVTTFESEVFSGDVSLYEFTFPNKTMKIGSKIFNGCTRLKRLSLTNLNGLALENKEGLSKRVFSGSKLEEIELPADYKIINSNVFEGANSLKTFVIGGDKAGVEEIDSAAFLNCVNLEEIKLKNSVKCVQANAFSGCKNLKSVEIANRSIELELDSFPVNSGMVVYSYGGTAEEWAGKHVYEGVKYKSLLKDLEIAINEQYFGNEIVVKGLIISDKKKVVDMGNGVTISEPLEEETKSYTIGTTIDITPKVKAGYTLISLTHGPNKTPVEIDSNGKRRFVVSEKDLNSNGKIQIDAAFGMVQKSETDLGDTIFKPSVLDREPLNKVDGVYSVTSNGENLQLQIIANAPKYGNVISNPTMWTFESNNKSYVDVNSNGLIKALKPTKDLSKGAARITAKFKGVANGPTIIINVKVNGTQVFDHFAGFEFPDEANLGGTGVDQETGNTVIYPSKAWIVGGINEQNVRQVTFSAILEDKDNHKMNYKVSWATSNSNIASLKKTQTVDGENTLFFCGVGEATITATVEEEKDSKGKIIIPETKESFIVRVVDTTPNIEQSLIVIDKSASYEAPSGDEYEGRFELIQSYEGVVQADGLAICKKNSNNQYEKIEDCFELELGESVQLNGSTAQYVYISVTGDDANPYKRLKTYSGLYLKTLVRNTPCYTLLPNIMVTESAKSTVNYRATSYKGKINTFYKANSRTEQFTSVEVELPTLAGYSVDKEKKPILVQKYESYQKQQYDNDEAFCRNFEVTPINADCTKVIIKQKRETLECREKKDKRGVYQPVLNGYVRVFFDNGTFIDVDVTVPTENKAPNLALSTASAATHKKEMGQKFEFSLVDVDKTNAARKVNPNAQAVIYDISESDDVTFTALNQTVSLKSGIDGAKDVVTFGMPIQAQKTYRGVVEYRNKDWNGGSIKKNFQINIDYKDPVPSFGGSSIALYTQSEGANESAVSFQYKAAYMDRVEPITVFEYTGKAKYSAEADKINVSFNRSEQKITADFNPNNPPAAGTYRFVMIYQGYYKGGNKVYSDDGKKCYIDVVVNNKSKANVSAKSTVVLNNILAGVTDNSQPVEKVSTALKYKYISLDKVDNVNLTSSKLEDLTTGRTYDWNPGTKKYNGAPIGVEFSDNKLNVYLDSRVEGIHTFAITGAKFGRTKVDRFVFNVKGINNIPIISLGSQRGRINALDKDTCVEYVVKTKYFSGEVDASKLVIVDETKNASIYADSYKKDSDFSFSTEKIEGQKARLKKAAGGKALDNARYFVTLKYNFGVDAEGKAVYSQSTQLRTDVTITNPTIVANPNAVTLYAANKSYVQKVKLNSNNNQVKIDKVTIVDSTGNELSKAFSVSYDKENDEIELRIRNSALLAKGQTYKVKLEATADSNTKLEKAPGSIFTVKINVK